MKLHLTEREELLIDFAVSRREALFMRDRVKEHSHNGFDPKDARRFARNYAARCRFIFKQLTTTP